MDEDAKKQIERYIDGIVKRSIAECIRVSLDEPDGTIEDRSMSPDTESEEISGNVSGDFNGMDSSEEMVDLDNFAEEMVNASLAHGVKEASRMKKTLCVGIVCLDLITECSEYPREDTETLAKDLYWARGGNASNTATILARLGAKVDFLGTILRNQWMDFLTEDFTKCGIGYANCVFLDDASHKFPVATIINSAKSGSRTALADFRNVTELSFEQFDGIDLTKYDWIHFEGRPRNPDIGKMMDKINYHNTNCVDDNTKRIKISVEIEQPHSICPELQPLFSKADVIFVSKDYAKDLNFATKEEAVLNLYNRCRPEATIICPWGEQGAAARWQQGSCTCLAFPPEVILDTLGAGDTFNAAAIYALHGGQSVQKSVEFACKVAGYKCGIKGFAGIGGLQRLL